MSTRCFGGRHRTTSCGAASNLLIAAAGAGVLSYPFAAATQGVILNVAATAAFACINAFTLSVVAAAAHRAHFSDPRCEDGRPLAPLVQLSAPTYEATIGSWLGWRWKQVAAASVLIGSIGALTGFTVIICDLVQPILAEAAGSVTRCATLGAADCDATLSFLSQRWVVAALFGAAMLPLSSARRLGSLAHSSILAAASVAAVTIVLALQSGRGGDPAGGGRRSLAGSQAGQWWSGGASGWAVLSTLPILVFALGNHLQLVPLWRDMVAPDAFPEAGPGSPGEAGGAAGEGRALLAAGLPGAGGMAAELARGEDVAGAAVRPVAGAADDKVRGMTAGEADADVDAAGRGLTVAMIAAAALCTLLYCVTGLVGLLSFGRDVCGDVLRSMGSPGSPALGCQGGDPSAAVAPVEPGGWAPWNLAAKSLMALHVALAFPVILFPCREMLLHALAPLGAGTGLLSRLLTALLLTASCAALAVGAPGVQVVFGLCGATVSVTQIYLLPAAILWGWAGDGGAPGSGGGPGRPAPRGPVLRRLCACGETPVALRVQAAAVFVVGATLGVLGTGVTIWQTWLQ